MNMFSDIATESTIEAIVKKIETLLVTHPAPEAQAALKEIGRFALTQFDWLMPNWAARYVELFK